MLSLSFLQLTPIIVAVIVMSRRAPLPLDFWCAAPNRPVVIICQNEKKGGGRGNYLSLEILSWSPQTPSICTVSLKSGPALNMTVTSIMLDPSSHPTRVIALSPNWILATLCLRESTQVLGSGPHGPGCSVSVLASDPSARPPETPGSFRCTSSTHMCPVSGTAFSPLPV